MNETGDADPRTNVPCPVCDSGEFRILYEPSIVESDPVKLYGAASGIRGSQRIVRCLRCTMIFENPRLPESEIIRGYEGSQESAHDSQHAQRVRSFARALSKLKNDLPSTGARVVDIGTAGGAFLDAAVGAGYDAEGLEPSRYLVDRGIARGLKISQGTIENNSLERGAYDMVTLWDVLEHVSEPRNSLEHIRTLLKPNGVLLVNYPDIGTPIARLAGRRFWWIISVHLHHFSQSAMCEILQRTGFDPYLFKPYWQTLQFGYLEQMSGQMGVPLAGLIHRLTPPLIKRIPVPYYASQTTVLARIAK